MIIKDDRFQIVFAALYRYYLKQKDKGVSEKEARFFHEASVLAEEMPRCNFQTFVYVLDNARFIKPGPRAGDCILTQGFIREMRRRYKSREALENFLDANLPKLSYH